jgi:hypothetical protein
MYDEQGNFIRLISPHSPIWPLPEPIMFFLFIAGMALAVVININFFINILKNIVVTAKTS